MMTMRQRVTKIPRVVPDDTDDATQIYIYLLTTRICVFFL